MRKEQFKRPEPGFSLYEGRTRGKKMKYTYSDEEDTFDSDTTNRRSTRNTGTNTPADVGPVTTASGRQIRAPNRLNANPGSSAPGSVQGDGSEFDKENSAGPTGRPRRSAAVNHGTSGWAGPSTRSRRNTSESDEESEAEFGDDEEDVDEHVPEPESEDQEEFDEDEVMAEDELDGEPRSLVVKLSVTRPSLKRAMGKEKEQGNEQSLPRSPLVEMQDAPEANDNGVEVKPPQSPALTPKVTGIQNPAAATIHVTPLAFRGSPEKAHAQPAPRPMELGTQE